MHTCILTRNREAESLDNFERLHRSRRAPHPFRTRPRTGPSRPRSSPVLRRVDERTPETVGRVVFLYFIVSSVFFVHTVHTPTRTHVM